jgi:ABC-type multidrug transport system fused ATPase/permease subunit
VILGVAPLMAISGVVEARRMRGMTGRLQKSFEECVNIATEAMTGSRTVAAFGLQPYMQHRFNTALTTSYKSGLFRAATGGTGQGVAMLLMMATYSLAFWAGAQFINHGWMTFQDLLQSVSFVLHDAWPDVTVLLAVLRHLDGRSRDGPR